MRVEIPPYCDFWMRGDRYGDVLNVVRKPVSNGQPNGFVMREVARVKLDISGRTVRVILADCQEV